ncbi:MAG: DUF6266 family protein [Bacteroidota bacterium]
MGIIRGGILGGFRNKAGSVIGSYWRRLDIIKGLPRISGKAPTQKQLDQRAKFGMVTGFCSWIGDLIDVGYKGLSNIDTPMNVAVSYHLKEAVTGVSPNFTLNYSKIAFSQGKLVLPRDLAVVSTTAAELDFTWNDFGSDGKYQDGSDMLSILVFHPVLFEFVPVTKVVARSTETYTMSVPAEFSGDQVHVYAAFSSNITTDLVSKTKYLGQVVVL